MPSPFSTQLDLKLIKLVKENPVLYNPRHPKHSDCDTRELTWQKIGDAIGRPTQRCKSRWLNVRDMMRRTLRSRIQYPKEQHKKYRFEDELSFLLPFYTKLPTSTTDNLPTTDNPEFLDVNIEAEIPEFEEAFVEMEDRKPIITYRKRVDESIQNRNDIEGVSQELNPADPLDAFLMTIGSIMRKFNPYFLNQAKSKIFQVCQDYELQQITDKPDQIPSTSTDVTEFRN